jgi:hypothetical protein
VRTVSNLAQAPTASLIKEIGGRVTVRGTLRYLRVARVLVSLVIVAGSAALAFGKNAYELLPFVHSGPAHHLGENGRVDGVVDLQSLLVGSPLLHIGKTQVSTDALGEASSSSLEDLTGRAEGRAILAQAGDENTMSGYLVIEEVFPDAIQDESFRQQVIDDFSAYVGDDPMTVAPGGMDAYMFEVRINPGPIFAPYVMLVFYENQVIHIGGVTDRAVMQHAVELLGSLP